MMRKIIFSKINKSKIIYYHRHAEIMRMKQKKHEG